MYDIQGVVRSGSRKATQGHWAGDNWLKLHQMENVIMRRVQSGNILNFGHNDLSRQATITVFALVVTGHSARKNVVKSFIRY